MANKPGQPTKYSQELATKICAELAQGKSIRTVCAIDGMPSIQTLFNWIHTNPLFLEQYTRAKEESADALVDEMQHLSDTVEADKNEIAKARLQVETRKWIASKLKPKKYGDKLDMTSDGKPVSFVVTRGGKDGKPSAS